MNRVPYSDPASGASNQANELLKAAKEELAQIKSQSQIIQKQNDDIHHDREALDRAREQLSKDRQELIDKLAKISSLTKDEAKKELLEAVDKELNEEIAKKIRGAGQRVKQDSDKLAREILTDAMRHGVTEMTAEYTISTVKLTDDGAKGQIIGQGGRNIRTFERATGVDVDLDETPGEVRLSSFDSVRREIARISLEKLLRDGRIQPSRIEEIVLKTKEEVEKIMLEEGKKLAEAVKVFSLPTELLQILGRFKYRFSYGQSMILHTLEETKIGIALAHELKADVDTVRLGCLLHDIGKVVADEEGSHIELGVKLLKKFELPDKVINCVAEHHEDQPFSSVESVIVYISDAISGGRPGARYEDYEAYAARLKKLESLAMSFAGVQEAFAIQAGREVRVIVKPEEVTDASVTRLAHDIAKKIEAEMTYPGTVTVNAIREIRASDVAH
ncbi:ribonuclease Y [Candidatus Collierbacteria bacterium]|nr:ribonuclease Y [Candidatus Collierbacteria bacterium]